MIDYTRALIGEVGGRGTKRSNLPTNTLNCQLRDNISLSKLTLLLSNKPSLDRISNGFLPTRVRIGHRRRFSISRFCVDNYNVR